jgi:putative redox protein
MQVNIKRIDDAFGFEAENETHKKFIMDANPSIGGNGQGFSPMQTLLAAIGGCSSIDIVSILKKQKQEINDFHITIDAEREQGKEPSLFTTIHVKYHLKGNIDPEKAKRAAELSIEKYCSVAKILEKTAKITYEVILN